jgi:hypothetical protein
MLHQTATSEDGLVLPYGGHATHNGELLNMLELNTLVKISLKTTKSKMDFLSTVGSGTTLENLVSYKVMMMVMNFTVEL